MNKGQCKCKLCGKIMDNTAENIGRHTDEHLIENEYLSVTFEFPIPENTGDS